MALEAPQLVPNNGFNTKNLGGQTQEEQILHLI